MVQEFKEEAYQLQIEMERLNHQAGLLLKKVAEEADRCAIQEPMSELKMLWDNLDEKIIGRQVRTVGGGGVGEEEEALSDGDPAGWWNGAVSLKLDGRWECCGCHVVRV